MYNKAISERHCESGTAGAGCEKENMAETVIMVAITAVVRIVLPFVILYLVMRWLIDQVYR